MNKLIVLFILLSVHIIVSRIMAVGASGAVSMFFYKKSRGDLLNHNGLEI